MKSNGLPSVAVPARAFLPTHATDVRSPDADMTDAAAIAAGWFIDPEDSSQYRWWNGASWTTDRSPVNQPAIAAPRAVTSPVPVPVARVRHLHAVPDLPELGAVPEPAPVHDVPPARASRASRPSRNFSVRTVAIIAAIGIALLAVVWLLFLRGGDAATTTNPATPLPGASQPPIVATAGTPTAPATPATTTATTPSTATTGAPGTAPAAGDAAGGAVPKAIDDMTGDGVGKATAVASQEQAQLVADAAAGDS